MPLLGNPTAAVFYPGKLIYAALPYSWAARVYVIAHVALAFVLMRALLRGWSISAAGATIGAMAFSFGAPVLFQYCNVVYLIGAAWMPLGLHFADRWIRLGNRRAMAGLAIVLALQILGGDPEAAYLVAIAAAGYAIGGGRQPSQAQALAGYLQCFNRAGNLQRPDRFDLDLVAGNVLDRDRDRVARSCGLDHLEDRSPPNLDTTRALFARPWRSLFAGAIPLGGPGRTNHRVPGAQHPRSWALAPSHGSRAAISSGHGPIQPRLSGPKVDGVGGRTSV